MEEIAISKFKLACVAILERVRKTRRPVRITKFGKPVVEIVPAFVPARRRNWVGSLSRTGRILGDIVSPASDEKDWEVLR